MTYLIGSVLISGTTKILTQMRKLNVLSSRQSENVNHVTFIDAALLPTEVSTAQ